MAILLRDTLEIERPRGSIKLNLKAPIVIVGGNSGTGKTYFVSQVKKLLRAGLLSDVVVLDTSNEKYVTTELREAHHKLIIIDKADLILYNNKIYDGVQFANDSNNQYLIFSKLYGKYGGGQERHGEFTRDAKGIIHLKYDSD